MTTNSNMARIAGLAASAALFIFAQPALAGQATGNLNATARVTKSCSISATPIAFGQVNATTGAAVDAAGTLTIKCTNGTAYVMSASGTSTTRTLTNGSNSLNYSIYKDTNRAILWMTALSATGTGSDENIPFYGRIAANQTSAPAGDYTNTITVTLTY